MGCLPKGCCANATVGVSATLYLTIGILMALISGATLFTPFLQIVTPLYAASGVAGGIIMIVIAIIGLIAACDEKKRVGLLWLFTLLTLAMVCATIFVTVVMFEYEALLAAASRAGVQAEAAQASTDINDAAMLISVQSTSAIRTVASNAFRACNASVSMASVSGEYHFACGNTYFSETAAIIDQKCLMSDTASQVGPSHRTWAPLIGPIALP